MTDKLPPRFAPEGARLKRADWRPEGSQADQQKRTYLDRIGDLESQISALKSDVAEADAKHRRLLEKYNQQRGELHTANDLVRDLKGQLSDFHEDRKGDMGRIADAKAELAQAQTTISTVTAERDTAARQIADLKRTLEGETAKYDAKVAELHAVLNPPKKQWIEIAKSLPLAGFLKNYYKYEHYRSSTHSMVAFISVPLLIYFTIAGFVVGGKDDPNPCFQSGGSYFYCGAVRGVLVPLKNGGAWMLGLGGESADNVDANASAPTSSEQADTTAVVAPPSMPTPEPVYVPPPPPPAVIDPNVIVKDLADQSRQIAVDLGWTEDQASCARREAIDQMRSIFVQGYARENSERTYDTAKSFFESVAGRCNSAGRGDFMNRMIYDDDNYFRKLQRRLANGEFGEVWPK